MVTAQEAYIQNLQYRAMNAPGTITAEEAPYAQQYTSSLDAAKEQAKMQVAFSQPRNDTQIQQSEAFKQITAEYAASRNRVVGASGTMYQGEVKSTVNPYPEGTAAAIAWEVGRTGGASDIRVAEKAIAEGAKPSEVYVATGQYIQRPSYGATATQPAVSLEPIRQNISVAELMAAPSTPIVSGISIIETPSKVSTESLFLGEAAGSTLSELYVPYGRYAQTRLENVKTSIDPLTGEIAIYQKGSSGRYGLIGGGGRAALQSGRFSTEPLTPFVTTQLGAGTYKLPKGEGLSRLGAEAYGGKVMTLDSRVLAPGTQMARYAGETNLANLAAQAPAGKAEAPGAAIPWSVSEGAPAIQLMSEKGLSGVAVMYGAQPIKTSISVLATGPVVTERGVGTRSLPEPFISFVGTTEKEQQRKYDVSVFGGYSGGLIGYALFGTKSPEVVKGFMGSVVDEITGIVGLRPAETIFKTTEGRKTYEYGEYTKAGESLGTSFRGSLGYTRPQLEAYGVQLEQKRGIETIPEKIVYGTGYTLTTRPEKFVSAIGAGITISWLGEIATAVSRVPVIATRVGAFEAAYPTVAATTSAAYRYGVPTGLLGVTYYSASEGLTATPERTTINIGKGTPELAGFLYGGYGGYQSIRAADSGYIGFKNIEKRIAFTEEALKSVNIELLPPEAARPTISKSTIREVSAFEPGTLQTVYSIRQRPIGTPGYAEVVTTDPFAQLSARGLDRPSLREEVTSAEFYSRYQSSIYGQPPSARTTILREKQLQDIFGSSLEPAPTGVMPMDILPGVGKIGELRVMESDIMAQNVAAIVAGRKPAGIGVSTERGIEYGGAPISQQMLETLVNPALTPARRATGATSIESTITETSARARVAPAIQYAASQKILPSKLSFEYPTTMKGIDIVNVYESVIQSEKRTYAPQTPKTLQKMIQPELTPFDYGPTRKTYEDYMASRVVSQVPSTKPSTVVTPVVTPAIKPTTRVMSTITPTTVSTQMTVVTPSTIPKTIPSVSQITIPTPSITHTTRITPMVTQTPQYTPRTAAITRVVGTPTPSVPSYPTKPITIAPPEYTPRTYKITPPTIPPYSPTPTTTPPIKSPPGPSIPGIPLFPVTSSVAGVTPGIRKRRAAFRETFMLGLDISMTGRRKVRAKSYKSPKKKAAKTRKKR